MGPKKNFWETYRGQRQLLKQAREEQISSKIQQSEADKRLREDGWIRDRSSGEYVLLADVKSKAAKKGFESMTFEQKAAVRGFGHRGKECGARGRAFGALGKGFGHLGKGSGILGKGSGILGKGSGILGKGSGSLGRASGILGKGAGNLGKEYGIMAKGYGQLGGDAGKDWYLTAPVDQFNAIVKAGQEFSLWASKEVMRQIRDAGKYWHRDVACEEEVELCRQIGKGSDGFLPAEERIKILSGKSGKWEATVDLQLTGSQKGHTSQTASAIANAPPPAPPTFDVQPGLWDCNGTTDTGDVCDFGCVSDVKLANFIGLDDLTMMKWVSKYMIIPNIK